MVAARSSSGVIREAYLWGEMRPIAYALAGLLALLGILFLVAAAAGRAPLRLTIGLVLVASSGVLVALVRLRPLAMYHHHRYEVDLSGETRLRDLTCSRCGATMDGGDAGVDSGAVRLICPSCGAAHQLEETPKW